MPEAVQAEMENGPVGYLHAQLKNAAKNGHTKLGNDLIKNGVKDLRHMLRNYEYDATERALDLLDQYQAGWREVLRDDAGSIEKVTRIRDALVRTGIPGLSGWGEAPGRSMVLEGEMLFPGIHFGNIFIGPQPPRGWEVSEELLHANTTFPPTHQYVGFYQWLRKDFNADALVYLGRHSTREFLPRRRAGLAEDDYPELLGKDLPLIYPYIVDGVGEGIQAKRRAMGVMVSHLTPPLETTKLYDNLLELRQLVETWESSNDPDSSSRDRAVKTLRERLQELDMVQDIEKELAEEHHGEEGHDEEEEGKEEEAEETVHLEDVDDELLVHEVGHYLTTMQESFMPLGLHVFGRDWDQEGIDTMLNSMAGDDEEPKPEWREKLKASPGEEMADLLAGLDGRFVPRARATTPCAPRKCCPPGATSTPCPATWSPPASPGPWARTWRRTPATRATPRPRAAKPSSSGLRTPSATRA